MESLRSLEEYKSLLASYKSIYRRGYNNNYLSTTMVKRYVSLGRIYYEADENALLFFTDEENYYRLYLLLGPEMDFSIKVHDKPVMVRNIYREGAKPDCLWKVEAALKKQGFALYDKTVQILAKPLEDKENIRRKYDKAISFLERFGMRIGYAQEEDMEQMMSLKAQEPLLKDYHFIYKTKSEILEEIKNGYYRCAYNHLGEVCAVQNYAVVNGVLQGSWLAVKDEYKVKYGIGSTMAYHSFLYAIEKNIAYYYGWVARDNGKSVKYHQSIGYEIGDKWADEWLLQ